MPEGTLSILEGGDFEPDGIRSSLADGGLCSFGGLVFPSASERGLSTFGLLSVTFLDDDARFSSFGGAFLSPPPKPRRGRLGRYEAARDVYV